MTELAIYLTGIAVCIFVAGYAIGRALLWRKLESDIADMTTLVESANERLSQPPFAEPIKPEPRNRP